MLLPALPVDLSESGLDVEEVAARAARGEPPASGTCVGMWGVGGGSIDVLVDPWVDGWVGRLVDSPTAALTRRAPSKHHTT